MSGPSGANTKDSKINRILQRVNTLTDMHQIQIDNEQETIATQQSSIERLTNSLHLSTEMNQRLEAENARLRRYLGSELFKRRQADAAIPTLDTVAELRALRALARCALASYRISGGPGITADPELALVRDILQKIAAPIERDRLEPNWGNRAELPHTTAEGV
jgi:regulator of replication initiation timing